MDIEQEELQFLGIFEVLKESAKVIFSWRKIFVQISLTLILPLSFIYLMHIEVSNILFRKILHNTEERHVTEIGTPKYEKLTDLISSEWVTFLLFKVAYITLALIFSLLSTSAVVYTIASIYTAKDVTFNKVMSVVPKVWKRLMLTFLCTFAAFFAYIVVSMLVTMLVIILWAITIGVRNGGIAVLVIIAILYFLGIGYLTVIWQLASVVTVLEDSYGVQAMTKSKELIKGKIGLSVFISFMLNVSLILIRILFKKFVVNGWRLGSVDRTVYGILCFLLLSGFLLYELVLKTVFYFVCKSYHHQSIDKSALADHLEVYQGLYVPLKAKDVQLEQYHV